MKFVQSLIVAALVAVPVASFAQSQHEVTRAEVRAELVQLQKAGYNPASDNAQYPRNIEAAEARINAGNNAAANAYGGVAQSNSGSSAAGSQAYAPMKSAVPDQPDIIGLGPIYAH